MELSVLRHLEPLNQDVWIRLADEAANKGDYRASKEHAALAVKLNSSSYPAWHYLANACAYLGEWEEALAASERVLRIVPGHPGGEWLRAGALAYFGRWKEAWKSYEHGRLTGARIPRCMGPEWDGARIDGKRLLVWCEQGHGDCIQYARFLAEAKAQSGATVIAEWRPLLYRLCQGLADESLILPDDKRAPETDYDYQISLLSLPHVLGLGEDDIDGRPYLSANPIEKTKGRIGITWKGSAVHNNDARRSVPDDLLELFRGCDLVAIQPDQEAPEWMDLPGLMPDFASTACAIAGLDLLISVDTATAHLAGALGVPVWLLPHEGEPRWGKGPHTVWYDSMTVMQGDMPTCIATARENLNGRRQRSH